MLSARKILLFGLIVIMVTGCSGTGAEIVPSPTLSLTSTDLSPTATCTYEPATPTNTALPPTPTIAPTDTPTMAALPSSTPTHTLELTPTATTSLSGSPGAVLPGVVEDSVRIFFIQKQTGGPICGDSVIPIQTHIPRTKDVTKDIVSALSLLFSYKQKYVGDLYNPVYASNLKVSRVEFTGPDEVTIRLTGTVSRTKEKCDNTRLKAQIWSTATQFKKDVKRAIIFLNNGLLGDMISNDG